MIERTWKQERMGGEGRERARGRRETGLNRAEGVGRVIWRVRGRGRVKNDTAIMSPSIIPMNMNAVMRLTLATLTPNLTSLKKNLDK